jgi:hypothetical protein
MIDASVELLTQVLLKIKSRTRIVHKDCTWDLFMLNALEELDIATTDIRMALGIGVQE